ncbi:peptide-methionine (S)-S-oxide reductase MsrA [Tenacibaculum caenipelagi]|uniref:Peptide methionine sulfoxide reductase MsrA n=1 Tax=Tenacibaculum caenipelagi TaxID=1325435 RepID=A0A4R6TCR4_9FLAO|nr:peptide-methionine (S)-S-oxide reductase MsrA [Tenacibaculum caenipelagi]TDQ25813.1 peptide-methionine (S)-S-oxide reductase [Tenacibaculum caenipelagi]
MTIFKKVTLVAVSFVIASLYGFNSKEESSNNSSTDISLKETKVAYFASGCFWCIEGIYESIVGVEDVISGYAGGHTKNPTYESVGTGRTGHAETIAVYYNPKRVSFQTLVDVFFGSHNPTTKNGQYPDYGTQYRSIAFYNTLLEKQIIENTIKKLNKEVYHGKIVTEVKKIKKFYPAEEYHQNYERLHPENPYVQKISIPRINRFKHKFPELLKKGKE